MIRLVAVLLIVGLHPIVSGSGVIALDIPIQVQELLPRNVVPHTRGDQVVSVGVPLSAMEHVQSISELGFSGSSAAQFRVLQRDNETQDIRWVLARFIGRPGGAGYSVTRGTGDFGGANLAVETDSLITIATGNATFEIRKQSFRFLDRVVRNGQEYVLAGGRGIVLQVGPTIFSSSNDISPEVMVEENGPLETVIRARGHLTDDLGGTSLAYTARIHFYRGQSTCRASVTLRNGQLASLFVKPFDAAWVELPMALDAQREIRFGTTNGEIFGEVAADSSAHLLQGDNVFMRSGRTGRITPYLTSAVGLEVAVGSVRHNTLGLNTEYAEGWMSLSDSTKRVYAGIRDFAAQFPGGFDVQNNLLSVELFSRHNPMKNLVFSWGAHETREILFDFTTPAEVTTQDFHYALQYPLIGRCSFEHYRSSGGIFGSTQLVTAEEEQTFFADLGKTWSLVDHKESDLKFTRQWSFSTTGGGNQFGKDETQLLDWLRSGYTGRFAKGRIGVLWKSDGSILHSDDFDYGDRQLAVTDVDVVQPDSFHGKGAGSLFDDEHPHWVSLPLYYWITGDERIREAIENYAEYRRYRAGNASFGAVKGGAIGHFRLWSRAFRDMALAYEITGRQRYLDDLRRMAGVLINTIEVDGSRGRSLDRGYFYFGSKTDVRRRIHLFFLTEMNPIGVREAMRVLPSADPLREELRDYLAGLAWFTLREAQLSPTTSGYPYGYFSAIANTVPGNRGDQTGILLTHGYKMSGDARFIERARSFAWRVITDSHELRASEMATQLRIYEWNHRDERGAVLLSPEANRNLDGSWTLSWQTPPNSAEYIVKYGDRTLVENLDFDQLTRTFAHNPDSTMNFWAATNLAGEPVPGPGSSLETWTTPVLPPGAWNFGVKILTNGSAVWPPNTQADFGRTTEDQPIALSVLANDVDVDGQIDASSLAIVSLPAKGQVEIDSTLTTVVYTPTADANGSDSFTYTVRDDQGNISSPTLVQIDITPINDTPIARDDFVAADVNETLVISVLSNDMDVDGDALQVFAVGTYLTAGTVNISPDGTQLIYRAPSTLVALDTFVYAISDLHGGVALATVSVETQTVAIAVSDFAASLTDEGVTLSWRFSSDEDVTGFQVLRSVNEGPFSPVPGGVVGASQGILKKLDPAPGLKAKDLLMYRLEAILHTGEHRLMSSTVEVSYSPPAISSYSLDQNIPNPFNPATSISFSLPTAGPTTLRIYNVRGRHIRTLVDANMEPGRHQVAWNGTDQTGQAVPSGAYYYRLVSRRFSETLRMFMVK